MVPDDSRGYWAYANESIAYARCCSDRDAFCTMPDPHEDWCSDAVEPMTYEQARYHCESAGRRLCTRSEVVSDLCCDPGNVLVCF